MGSPEKQKPENTFKAATLKHFIDTVQATGKTVVVVA
jgi:hypothetical protein